MSRADPQTLSDLVFAWRACRAVKSNAIVIAKDGATVGVGMGQVNRVDAAGLAVQRAGDRVPGSVGASDAFFPFPDGMETLTNAGVKAIVHPGGSVRDAEVTAAAEARGHHAVPHRCKAFRALVSQLLRKGAVNFLTAPFSFVVVFCALAAPLHGVATLA